MCDTLVALGNSTVDGSVIFAKNSDREPNEAEQLLFVPSADHAAGSQVQCTYISIPQVLHTYSVLLAKPFWIWGGEMGSNEHGVVIGNEAVFTRVPYEKGPGLIGMDFLRLALERTASALEAMNLIIALLEQYGQGGNCGFTHSFYYHNSFLIADPKEAWVLETAGRQWAAEKVNDIRTISNAITIGSHWDRSSNGLIDYAVDRGWCKRRKDFDFGRCYSDPLYTRLSAADKRQCTTTDLMRGQAGKISIQSAMDVLRFHGSTGEQGAYSPDRGITGADVCMHAGWGPVRNSQSVGSMVSHLSSGINTHWLTGTSGPCTSIFKPIWLDAGLPDMGSLPKGVFDDGSLWWRHELLHREVLRDYRERLPLYQEEREEMEHSFLTRTALCTGVSSLERFELSQNSFLEAENAREVWRNRIRETKVVHRLKIPYALAWKGFNRQAGLS